MSAEELPTVSIVTPTIGRKSLFQLPLWNFMHFDYPAEKLEWIIVDEGPEPVRDLLPDDPRIKYYYFEEGEVKALYTQFREKLETMREKMKSQKKKKGKKKVKARALLNIHKNWFHKGRIPLGMKRNLCASYATGDIIVHMDDDDYYPPDSVRIRVETIIAGKKNACGCSTLNNYYPKKFISFGSVPEEKKPYDRRVICASLAYTREFWEQQKFDNQDINEEISRFVKGRKGDPIEEIDPAAVIVAFVHEGNYVHYPELQGGDSNGWHFGKLDDKLFQFISNIK